jgi:hypothetical protein
LVDRKEFEEEKYPVKKEKICGQVKFDKKDLKV